MISKNCLRQAAVDSGWLTVLRVPPSGPTGSNGAARFAFRNRQMVRAVGSDLVAGLAGIGGSLSRAAAEPRILPRGDGLLN